MASSSIREMTGFESQTQDVRIPPKKALVIYFYILINGVCFSSVF